MSDTPTTEADPSGAPAEGDEAVAAPESPPKVFEPRRGMRVRFGPRHGKIAVVRGNGDAPYEVQIRWDGQKYPEWFIYRTLVEHFGAGTLEVL